MVGVRVILNYSSEDPSLCWPQVDSDYLSPGHVTIHSGLSLLSEQGLSFDLQCNWFQLAAAAEVLKSHQKLVVIVNHLGCLKLGM